MNSWGWLVIALVLNAAANVLLKLGAATERAVAADGGTVAKAMAFLNGITIVAILAFGLNVLFYRKALQGLPLTIAYPVMLSGSLLLASIAATAVPAMREHISLLQIGGMVLIVVGVWLVTRS